MKYQDPARSVRSAELYRSACAAIPAGVNSTARAPWSGWDPYPLFVERGEGAYLYDVDGNAYIDYLLGLGPMILGHRPPKVTAAVVEQIQNRGTVFALPTAQEALLAHKIIAAVPSVEQVRLCNTGPRRSSTPCAWRAPSPAARRSSASRACITASRTGSTGASIRHSMRRVRISGRSPLPQGPGLSKAAGEHLIILPWNDAEALRAAVAREGDAIAAILTEPVMCNTGCILPEAGYLRGHAGDRRFARHRADLR